MTSLTIRLRRSGSWAVLLVVAVLAMGIGVTTVLTRAAVKQERHDVGVVVDRRAQAAHSALSSETERYVAAATQVAAAIGARTGLTDGEFTTIVAPLVQRPLAGASGVAFIVPVADGQIGQVQVRWRARGEANLLLQPAAQVHEHAFSVLGKSLDAEPAGLGRDLAQVPQIEAALPEAASSGTTVVSQPYVLLKDRQLPPDRQQLSFMIAAPIPARVGSTPVGWVLLALRGQDFADQVLRTAAQDVVNISLISGFDSRVGTGGSVARTVATVRAGHTWVAGPARDVVVAVGQQRWQLHVQSTTRAAGAQARHLDTLVAGAGALITLLLVLLTQMLTSSRWRALKAAEAAVAELRQAEAASRRDAGLLAAVMDSIGDGVGVVDSRGDFLLHNRAAKSMLGVQDDVAGPDPWQQHYGIFRPDGVTPFPTTELPLVRALAGEATDLVDMVIRNPSRPDGLMISVTGRPIDLAMFGMDGRGAVAVFHDVTQRRRLDAQLRLQHDRYERLLGILSDLGEGVLVVSGYQITYANAAYSRLTGYSQQELLALSQTAVLAADEQSLADFTAIHQQLSSVAKADVQLTRVRHKDGQVVPVEVAAMRLDEKALGTSECVYVVRDLTERRRSEAELADRASALQEANEQLRRARAGAEAASMAKSQFLSTMSHEIRTPLNGVLGFTTLLADSPRHKDAPEWARTADAAGRMLLDIVNSGLDLAKIEAGAVELESVELNLLHIAREAMLPSRLIAEEAGVELRLVVGDGLACQRRGDPVRIRQVMTNLISNAVKFTARGSVVVALQGQKDRVCIRVIDTGIGMDAEQQQRLFTPFQQATSDITRRYGGTGLGLSIAHGLVQAMTGSITVTSEVGTGTTFTVELPVPLAVEHPGQARVAEPAEVDLGVLSGLRALVVEDNHTNQLIAQAMLRKRGLQVTLVDDGEPAVPAALSGDYDVVFMDCQMPVMGGLEATRRIRAGESGSQVPIIAMTANTYADERQACLEAGMNDFLPKPWTASQLSDVLARLAQQHDLHKKM